MDKLFEEFENWYKLQKMEWQNKGLVIDEARLSEYGHQYWIKLHSDYGIGNIVLYESNGYYWVDFEAGNYDYDELFYRINITFRDANSICAQEKDFIEYLTWNGQG